MPTETYPCKIEEERDIKEEATILEDIREGSMEYKLLINHTSSFYMHSLNEQALVDMHDFEVVDILGSEKNSSWNKHNAKGKPLGISSTETLLF